AADRHRLGARLSLRLLGQLDPAVEAGAGRAAGGPDAGPPAVRQSARAAGPDPARHPGDRLAGLGTGDGRRLAADRLQGEFAVRLVGIAERVVAGETGVAVVRRGAPDRLVDAGHREVGERVGVELVGDLLDGAAVGDHLLAGRHVNAVVAGVADRRRRDPQV